MSPPVEYTALGPILSEHGVVEPVFSVLMQAAKGRACLLLEVNEFVMKNHLHLDQSVILKVNDVKHAISHVVKPEELKPHVGKYFDYGPRARPWSYYGVHTENVIHCRPKDVQWITYVSSGNPVTASALANAAENVFRECEHVSWGRQAGRDFHSFAARAAAIGMAEIVSPVRIDETDEANCVRRPFGKTPRAQISDLYSRMSQPCNTDVPWTYVGLLQREARVRLMLTTIAKSWRSSVSAWRAWGAFLDATAPFSDHFPASDSCLAAFAGIFDNCDSLAKYVQHLKKAHLLLDADFVPLDIVKSLLNGAAKFHVRYQKSFMTWQPSSEIVEGLIERGDRQLARFLAVAYQFQMRVQSELVPLQTAFMTELPEHDDWHSFVRFVKKDGDTRRSAEIILRVRKNKDVPTSIRRKCQCQDTPWLCGVCALYAQVQDARGSGSTRVFPDVVPSDISVIQKVARDTGFEGKVTWHGFRRGRTSDLLTCDWKEKPSVRDVFLSGGWSFGSRAVLKYLSADSMDPHRVVVKVAANSDSEKE